MGPRNANTKGTAAANKNSTLVPGSVYQTGFDPESSLRSTEKRKRDYEPPIDDDELVGLGTEFDDEAEDIPDPNLT